MEIGNIVAFTIRKHGFSNSSSWQTGIFLLMNMSILIKGPKHVFFDQSIWLRWLIWPIHLVKLDNPSQNGQWVLVKWDTYAYYIPTSYLPFTILQPTYLPTRLPKCTTYLPTHPLISYNLLTFIPS